jgi:putative addiction module CopG family antidote
LEQYVSAKMQPVRYNSASEVVREALCLLEEHDSARARLQRKAEQRRKPRP